MSRIPNTGYMYILNQRVWFLDGQAFSRSHDLASRPPSFPPLLPSVSSTGEIPEDWGERDSLLPEEWGKGWVRSRIIRPQEILVLYKSFNILFLKHTGFQCQNRNIPGFAHGILRAVESEGRQMKQFKQCWIKYSKKTFKKSPLEHTEVNSNNRIFFCELF
jgi:hypothetical protein